MVRRTRYILSLRFYNRFLNKYGKVECYKCTRPLEVDEEVFSRTVDGRTMNTTTRLYCIPCAKDLYFVDDEDE